MLGVALGIKAPASHNKAKNLAEFLGLGAQRPSQRKGPCREGRSRAPEGRAASRRQTRELREDGEGLAPREGGRLGEGRSPRHPEQEGRREN